MTAAMDEGLAGGAAQAFREQSEQENSHCASDGASAGERLIKARANVRVLAALAGCTFHIIDDGNSAPAYLVGRWNMSRTFSDLCSVQAFIKLVGSRNV